MGEDKSLRQMGIQSTKRQNKYRHFPHRGSGRFERGVDSIHLGNRNRD